MKILHVADLHYDLKKFDWIVDVAPEVDLLVMAGDHLEIANQIERPAQAVVIRKYFQRINKLTKLVISSGNHDLDERDEFGELTSKWMSNMRLFGVATDGDSFEFDDIFISICPWWSGRNSQFDVIEQLERDAKRSTERWIWIHHAPPEQSPTSWDGRNCYGAEDLRDWITQFQPDLVLSGHIHQSPYVKDGSWVDRIGKTWIFNGGHQPGRVPSHVLIDLDINMAFWKSAYGAQTTPLTAELSLQPTPLIEAPEWVMAMDRWVDPRQA